MPHPRQHVPDLAEICLLRGVARIVVSPGSRNAPLVDAFYRAFGDRCLSVVDERSAAFVALGLARGLGNPVALLCSSGTAVLNYGPALAEARYQGVPILAVTADRPPAWIDQQDNQTIRQESVFSNYALGSWSLPAATPSDDDLWFAQRSINEAINVCMGPPKGPVHLNVPLEEPLSVPLPPPSGRLRLMEALPALEGGELPAALAREWESAKSILIVHGQDSSPEASAPSLLQLARDPRVALVAENISNLGAAFAPGAGSAGGEEAHIVANPELTFARALPPEAPELLVYSGGHVVSKRLKAYLRPAAIRSAWRVGPDAGIVDTYQQTTRALRIPSEILYPALARLPIPKASSDYGRRWLAAQREARLSRDALLPGLPFSDIAAVGTVLAALPEGSILELGNSSTVRNAQLFDPRPGILVNSNRGVSGIDGSLSSAVGAAMASGRLTTCILGDLSFVYDSNALWNRDLPAGLRVVVVNNRGGAIFGLIGAPLERLPHRSLIEAHHPVKMDSLAEAFGLSYFRASKAEELAAILPSFFAEGERAALLEIEIPPEVNPEVFAAIMGKKKA